MHAASGPGHRSQAAPDRTLYVGNLPYDCTQQELEQLISGVVGQGQVVRVHLPTDPDGRKRGFGFVTMASADSAKTASDQLKSADLRGRRLVVNLAHPKGERPPRAEGGGFGGGGGGFGGGGGGGFGGSPSNFGPPQRKTFDERRRKQYGSGGGDDGPRKPRFGGGAGGDDRRGGGGGRGRNTEDDWSDDE